VLIVRLRFPRLFPQRCAFRNALLILCGLALLSASALATPTEEITRAVAVNGVSDVSLAQPKQFLKAFTAVAFRAQPRELPDYVIAAVNLRPDLSPRIVAVAIRAAVKNWEAKPEALCAMIDRIIRAAVAADPESVVSIVRAGASVSPELRHCIIAGAIAAAPREKDAILHAATAKPIPFAFLTFSATDNGGFSFTPATLSPANISDLGNNGSVTSPEQPPSP
jgi:hypothetical protein